jgi:hypothetical protein
LPAAPCRPLPPPQENDAGGARGKKSKPVTDLRSLSGGERSYTTVAFMLALGEYVEAPFK